MQTTNRRMSVFIFYKTEAVEQSCFAQTPALVFSVDFVKVLGAPFYRVLYETFWLLYDQEDSIT